VHFDGTYISPDITICALTGNSLYQSANGIITRVYIIAINRMPVQFAVSRIVYRKSFLLRLNKVTSYIFK
jgi:hypothetical protein